MHEELYKVWVHIIASPTKILNRARLAAFRNSAFSIPAIKHWADTWLVWAEKLGACWVDEIPHFRNKKTSWLEGMHKLLKDYVQSHVGDMKTVYDWLTLLCANQRVVEIIVYGFYEENLEEYRHNTKWNN